MRTLGRTLLVLGLVGLTTASRLAAQQTGFESFKWYFGAQGGVTIIETPTQTKGAIPTVGGHILITAKRTGLLFSVEEGFKKNQTTSYADNTVVGGSRQVLFNDIRKYSVAVVFFPFRTVAQPYFGFGAGILHTVKEYPQGFFGSPAAADTAAKLADRLGGHGFASFTGGVQFRVNRFIAFGQYQLASSPSGGKLLTGASHAFTAGLRIGLGSSREETTGGGY